MKKKFAMVLGVIWGIISIVYAYALFTSVNLDFSSFLSGEFIISLTILLILVLFVSTAIVLIYVDEPPITHIHTSEHTMPPKESIIKEPNANNYSKAAKISAAVIIVVLSVGYLVADSAYKDAYSKGEDAGYSQGYEEGKNDGYDKGYDAGKAYGYDWGQQDAANNTTSAEAGYYEAGTSDDVYVTPSGEKYHHSWCRYVSDRYDLYSYSDAASAKIAGYEPCSVCH